MSDRPVGDDIDRELRTVMADLADAAPPAPDYELISSPLYASDNGEVSEMRRTRWIVAGAAAAVVLVLVIVGVAVANTNDDEASETATETATEAATETATEAATETATEAATETATEAATETATEAAAETATEPETASEAPVSDLELAAQFLDDLHSLDTEATLAVMEADAIVNYLAARSTDDIPGLQGVMEARDWEYTTGNCAEVAGRGAAADDESTTRFVCDVTFEDAVSRAAGFEPYPGSVVEVWIENGTVALLRLNFDWPRHDHEVAAPFRAWLSETHPEDASAMYGPEGIQPAVTPESTALWAEYTAEYIAEKYR